MGFDIQAKAVVDALTRADGIVITKEKIIEAALIDAFSQGKERAALYVRDEAGVPASLAEEIRNLPCCF